MKTLLNILKLFLFFIFISGWLISAFITGTLALQNADWKSGAIAVVILALGMAGLAVWIDQW